MNHLLPTATTSDEKSRDATCAVLPVGSFEQHGDYLPLITDTVIASAISRELASAYPVLQLPPVTISCSHEHSAWRGTVSISSSTLHSMIDDIYRSATDSGLTSLVILNCHGGNYVLANVVQEGNAHGKRMAFFPSPWDWAEARKSAKLASSSLEDMHAGEIETSILLHANPELVRDGYHTADWVADDRRLLLTTGMSEYTQSGVIGRPSLASAEKGQAVLASLTKSFASVLETLQRALRLPRHRVPASNASSRSLRCRGSARGHGKRSCPRVMKPRQIRGNERLTALAALPRLVQPTELGIAIASLSIEGAGQPCSTMIIRV
jgi:creatinine amidohydrolase